VSKNKPSYMMQAGFSLGMFFDAEDGEHTILRNVEL
jgi:hypothetical protein